MANAEKFKQIFGIYATELWAMSEEEFLAWLNAEAKTKDWIPCSERLPDDDGEYLVTDKYSKRFPPQVGVLSFSKDLYKISRYDFEDEEGKAGFYFFDNEWGFTKVNTVTAWKEKPEPFQGDKNDSVQGNRNGND